MYRYKYINWTAIQVDEDDWKAKKEDCCFYVVVAAAVSFGWLIKSLKMGKMMGRE